MGRGRLFCSAATMRITGRRMTRWVCNVDLVRTKKNSVVISLRYYPTTSVVCRSEFLATDLEAHVRLPELPDFLRSSGLGLVSTIEELLGRNSSCSGLESREYDRGDPSPWPRGSPLSSELALTSSVGIIRSRTQATGFSFSFNIAAFPWRYWGKSLKACRSIPSVPAGFRSKQLRNIPYILESNPHLVFATFLNEKKLVCRLYHFSKIQL
jgi:hypothetical protein